MNRRDFLRSTAVVSAGLAWSEPFVRAARAAGADAWRTFEITTRIEILRPSGPTRVWVPTALLVDTPYQRTLGNSFTAPGGVATLVESKPEGLGIVSAQFPDGARPVVTQTSRVSTRNVAVNLAAPGTIDADRATLARFLRPTRLLPTDGIVKRTATSITSGAKTDLDKARAIYEWIVDNTFRDPKTRGCGIGDIRFMLESGNLGGKCADLNALYVGLARAAGLPARDVYGIRAAPSDLGYRSLGASSDNVTKAQHCRAEVFLAGYGWVPVDPADVRKVVLEEPPGNRAVTDDMVVHARARLFGSWEMNWIAFNFAHDVALPGARHAPLGYLMYPQAETAEGLLDSLDPDAFKYEITSREAVGTKD
jgi:transglutaminase-like putative cysteine protease